MTFLLSHIAFLLLAAGAAITACNEHRYQNKTEAQWRAELATGDDRAKRWAAEALRAMGAHSDETDHALVQAFHEPSDAVSAAAAAALAPRPAAKQLRDVILDRLWRIARSPGEARIAALDALALETYRDPATVPILAAALGDPSPAVRATAASSLRAFGTGASAAIPALQAVLRDTNELVRHEAADALSAIAGRSAH